MQFIGDTMPLGWDLVRHMESNPKIDPKLGIDGAEVRKQEKDMMTYQSEWLIRYRLYFLFFAVQGRWLLL